MGGGAALKKLYRAFLGFALIGLLGGLFGCRNVIQDSGSTDIGETVSQAQGGEQPLKPVTSVYSPPAGLFAVDLTEEDPSNSQITFQYDKRGRIALCSYQISGEDIRLQYSYNGEFIQISGFSGSRVAETRQYQAKAEYDPSIPFSEHDGYYFKGFTF